MVKKVHSAIIQAQLQKKCYVGIQQSTSRSEGMACAKKQSPVADHQAMHAAQPDSSGRGTAIMDDSSKDEKYGNIYKFRNGRGDVLQTPKRSSMTRAKALLTTPPKEPPCKLTVTGADWPIATVVGANLPTKPVSLTLTVVTWFQSPSLPAFAYGDWSPVQTFSPAAGHRERT